MMMTMSGLPSSAGGRAAKRRQGGTPESSASGGGGGGSARPVATGARAASLVSSGFDAGRSSPAGRVAGGGARVRPGTSRAATPGSKTGHGSAASSIPPSSRATMPGATAPSDGIAPRAGRRDPPEPAARSLAASVPEPGDAEGMAAGRSTAATARGCTLGISTTPGHATNAPAVTMTTLAMKPANAISADLPITSCCIAHARLPTTRPDYTEGRGGEPEYCLGAPAEERLNG